MGPLLCEATLIGVPPRTDTGMREGGSGDSPSVDAPPASGASPPPLLTTERDMRPDATRATNPFDVAAITSLAAATDPHAWRVNGARSSAATYEGNGPTMGMPVGRVAYPA